MLFVRSDRRLVSVLPHAPVVIALFVLALCATRPAAAQQAGRGFLFGTPNATLGLRVGYAQPAARSDLFSFTTKELTLDRHDFAGFDIDADLGLRLASRTDFTLGLAYAGSTRRSEFRDFIDNNNQPIEQTTRFQRVPLTIGIKQYLAARGRSIGRYAWIPARIAPYLGAAAGTEWYRFHQDGDFVDYTDNSIYTGVNETSGWGFVAHADAGLEYTLTPALALSGQARYSWASAGVGGDFTGFKPIDLSGFTTSVGMAIRF